MNHTCAVLSVAASLLGSLLFGLCLGFSGPAIDTMKNDVTTPDGTLIEIGEGSSFFVFRTATEASLFGSMLNIGAMVGALGGGPLNEKIGRRWSLIGVSPLFALPWLWVALATTAWQLIVARVIMGIALGMSSFTVPTYIGEVSPTKYRGLLGACNQVAITVGILLAYVLGLALRTKAGSVDPNATATTFCEWRQLSFIYIIPSALLGIAMFFAPESPRWLASKCRDTEAKAVLIKLRGADENDPHVKAELAALDALHTKRYVQGKDSIKQNLRALSECKMQLFIGVMLQVLQQFAGVNGIIFYQTSIFQAAGIDNRDVVSLSVMAVQVGVTLIGALIIEKAGRRLLLISAASGMCISAILEGLFFYLRDSVGNQNVGWLAIVAAFGYIATFSLGVGGIPWLILAELFPDEVRGVASSIATVINWLCSFLVTELMESMTRTLTFYGTFWFFAGVSLMLALFVVFLVPETKGRTFEEIQAYFQRRYHFDHGSHSSA
ncbi:hexose transporter, putative [Perkinsus marinus ATCC 50983]|uniref:Hexose transporter 1 n=1 Tax=Perkinsus marinus (strain ATCC 50983 / TXsc) TaxID=423536 RepID=C5L545_PERM5|nr:hexose transporter, putative [Perkinsus marinus ATCC 50983]XP_002776288.1 hexose transporter, putative [Perkinsus marinus ATCC 50983]EER06837.1 hexose transporter, putative [Perkinsus marinus ATCC 50983]EER08104.1 hexose transporter, putative [Perkinsus marinus ATCC 50983]|eukprot:XP_002775021.1 hexose transporter, putative [Perkinsus marinus ATCC 50983]